ncbi:hypothetical protein GCM10008020_23740 [Massilia psychrophila]|nr:hypothetical protein GCM10008020_23740 [Massilia psychrophila]
MPEMNFKPEQLRFASIPGFLARADVEGGALSSAVGPLLLNEQRRHPLPKMKYKVTHWADHDAGLGRCGNLTLWVTEAAIAGWNAAPRLTAGGQPCYSDLAIETALMLRLAFHLPLHQTEGLINSIAGLMKAKRIWWTSIPVGLAGLVCFSDGFLMFV